MSRAFVKEHDGELPEDLPERPISPHQTFVTARGQRQIDTRIRELETAREQARIAEDKSSAARIERDLRYWLQRKSSAKLVQPDPAPTVVRFGVRATIRYEDSGEERSYTLVGEDEAAPAAGLISWASPIGRALIGAEVGDVVALQERRAEVLELAAGAAQ
ncbi:MAG TPA: GreA/GreB family elongation factor [Steroidobacter sp.]|nr:GreA/GreB family elongation factor [Steroidobacter sp.]